MSERWVVPTNVELEKGGAREGGVVELGERMIDGGLCFGLKVEALSCFFACGGTAERGSAFWRKEKAESCVWGNGRAIYRVLERKISDIYVYIYI